MNLKKKTLLLSYFLLLLVVSMTAQTSNQTEQLFEKFKSAARFDYTYPREKVYVHFNSSSYLVGDTIWYKAYVVRASSLKPTTLSGVLYVELLNADGQQITKQTLKIDSMGTAHGAIPLPTYAYGGYYEILAYTREMVNWGSYACFSRVLPVFTDANPQHVKEKGLDQSLSQLSLLAPTQRKYPTVGKPRPYEMSNNKKRLLDFYPEGGNRVKGTSQRIAFKLTDGTGLPTCDSIYIYYADGEICTQALPEHEGMGSFELPADFSEGYAKVQTNKSQKYELPQSTASYALKAEQADSVLNISIITADSIQNELWGLAIFNRENACYFDTLSVKKNSNYHSIPYSALRGGVNRIELFNQQGHSLSTRLVWKPIEATDSARFVQLEVLQNERAYKPFSPAVVIIRAQDNKGKPIRNANLSFAARDEATTLLDNADGGISGDLLLASELRGYIHRPDLYFQKNDAAHHRMLDLLMMVQGWCANSFDTMCKKDSFELLQPIEDKLLIKGTLYTYNKRRPLSKAKIDLKAYGYEDGKVTGGSFEGTTTTDNAGQFAFMVNANIEGNYLSRFKINKIEKEQQKWCRLYLDRWLTPQLRPFWCDMLTIHPYQGMKDISSVSNNHVKYFEWTDTIVPYKVQNLKTATVSTRRKYKGLTGTRYSWDGGVNKGIRASLTFYNIQKECERFRDFGLNDLNIFEFLNLMELKCKPYSQKNNRNITCASHQLSIGNSSFDNEAEASYNKGLEIYNNTLQLEKAETINETESATSPAFKFSSRQEKNDGGYVINGHAYKFLLNNQLNPTFFNEESNCFCKDFDYVTIVRSELFEDNLSGTYKRRNRGKDADNKDLSDYIYFYERSDEFRTRNEKGCEYRNIQGFTPPIRFYSPNYRKFDLPTKADTRRTLLWAPQIMTNEKGEATLIFFTNSRESETLDISIRGITADGQFIDWN